MCDAPATGVEHVPAKCFFPKGQRINLITVPSCDLHNNATSKDDEYTRGIIVSCSGNNKLALSHWRGDVRKGYIHSPKLFLKTFREQKDHSFFHDRSRIDSIMIKIAYGLYYHTFKKVWNSTPVPYYKQFRFDDGKTDIEVLLPNYQSIPEHPIYEGSNQAVFKYQYLEGKINGREDCLFKLIFYDGFEVLILPSQEQQ
jgi:hypothetical protein